MEKVHKINQKCEYIYIIFKQNTQKINSSPCLFLKRIKSIASMNGIFTYIYHISPLKTTIPVGKYTNQSPLTNEVRAHNSILRTICVYEMIG